MELDRNLLFGLLAMQVSRLTAGQFARGISVCAEDNDSLADASVRNGWLSPAERHLVEQQLQHRLAMAQGDARQVLRQLADGADRPAPRAASASQSDAASEVTIDSAAVGASPSSQALFPSSWDRERHTATMDSESPPDGSGPVPESPNRSSPSNPPAPQEIGPQEIASSAFEETIDTKPLLGSPVDRARLESEATSDFALGTRSRYTLTRIYGEGGLGQVWLAIDPNLNRQVALKNIRPDRNRDARALRRLVREAQITGQLEHPNIIPVYELAKDPADGQPYYTMKFLGGKTLQQRISDYHRRRKRQEADPLELRHLLSAFVGICNALAYAGSRGIVHRDLKPQNIMLGDFGEVIVLDWGLAKRVGTKEDEPRDIQISDHADATRTLHGQVVGSPAYMAPEQARGHHHQVDQRTDIYGLGSILFAIVCGKAPHRGDKNQGTLELLRRISTGETPRLRSIDPTAPAALDAICARAMSANPADRYATAMELAQDVERWLADEPVSAYPEPWRQRWSRWLRRHRAWALSAAVATLLIAVISVVATVVVERARREETLAHAETRKALNAEAQALREAKKAKEEATRRFRQAQRAVDQSFTGISEGLQNYPGVQRLRTKLLENAAQHYEQFARDRTDDPTLKLEFALALVRLGDVRRLLAKFEEAKAAYEQGLDIFRSSLENDPDSREIRLAMAQAQSSLGMLYATVGLLPATGGRDDDSRNAHASAKLAYDAAESMLTKLLAEEPRDLACRRAAARVRANRGVLLSRMSGYDEALATLREAEDLLREIAKESNEIGDREELAKSQIALAEVWIELGQNDSAAERLNGAIDTYEQLIGSDADEPRFLQGRADARLTLANALQSAGRKSESIPLYQAAIEDYYLLVESRPDVPLYRDHLATTEVDLAQVLTRLGRNQEAKERAEAGLSLAMDLIAAHPDVTEYFVKEVYAVLTLGQVLRDLNDLTLAETAFKKSIEKSTALIDLFPDNALYRRLRGESRNALGVTHLLSNAWESARQSFLDARSDFEKAVELSPKDVFSRDSFAWSNTYLGDALRRLDRTDEAQTFYRQALAQREALQTNAELRYRLAWLLVHCGDPSLRDPLRAIEIASQLRKENATMAEYAEVLAVAWYRQGNWDRCLEELDKAEVVRISRESPIDFWRAMALWQRDEKDKARQTWDLAVMKMERDAPGDLKLRQARDEASRWFESDRR